MYNDQFRFFLNAEFELRKQKNKHYSMRTFAKNIGLSVSVLSRILSDKSQVSLKNLRIVNSKLKLPDGIIELAERSQVVKKKSTATQEITFLSAEKSFLVQTWYFAVIWESFNLNQTHFNAKILAKKLDISVAEVKKCIKLMVDKKLIYKDNHGHWKTDYSKASSMQIENTNLDLKELQIKFFLNSIDAIRKIDISQRDHSTIFIAGDDDIVAEVKQKIDQFRRSIDRLIVKKSDSKSKQVFQLSIGFSPTLNS